jgi:hypothetical protein
MRHMACHKKYSVRLVFCRLVDRRLSNNGCVASATLHLSSCPCHVYARQEDKDKETLCSTMHVGGGNQESYHNHACAMGGLLQMPACLPGHGYQDSWQLQESSGDAMLYITCDMS